MGQKFVQIKSNPYGNVRLFQTCKFEDFFKNSSFSLFAKACLGKKLIFRREICDYFK